MRGVNPCFRGPLGKQPLKKRGRRERERKKKERRRFFKGRKEKNGRGEGKGSFACFFFFILVLMAPSLLEEGGTFSLPLREKKVETVVVLCLCLSPSFARNKKVAHTLL